MPSPKYFGIKYYNDSLKPKDKKEKKVTNIKSKKKKRK